MSTIARQALLKTLRCVGVRRFTVTSPLGYRFVCHVGDLAGEHPFVNLASHRAELTLMAAWCLDVERPVIYDIGANVGFVATQLAQLLKDRKPQIVAFEPVVSTFRKLDGSIRMLGLTQEITPVCCAISDRTGFVSIASDDTQSLFAQVRPDSGNMRAGRELSWVSTQTLDQVASSFASPPTLVKVDVEGFESYVFRGAQSLLSGLEAPAILFEFNPLTLTEVGSSTQAIADALPGYAFFYVDDFEGQKIPSGSRVDAITSLTHTCNLFAVPDKDLSSARWQRCHKSLVSPPDA